MNRSEFSSLIRNPGSVGRGSLSELREVLHIFPWFQSAHLLILKGLKNTDDVKFDIQLKESAPHISDRTRLYYLLNYQDEYRSQPETITEPEEEAGEVIQDDVAEPEEATDVSFQEGDAEPAGLAGESLTAEAISYEELNIVTRPEDLLRAEIDKRLAEIDGLSQENGSTPEEDILLEIEGSTVQSVIEDSGIAPARHTGPSDLLEIENGSSNPGTQKDLIDRFIEMNPRLEVSRDRESLPAADLSEPHTTARIPFASETLAKIYIEQGYYSRAIEIYDKLCLKYPEKSSYFAGQIEKINDLIKNG